MKITKDEGWREISEALTNLLSTYDVPRDRCIDIIEDIEYDLESVVREYGKH